MQTSGNAQAVIRGAAQRYLGRDGREAAAELHVLPDLAAVGGQQPRPQGAVVSRRPVAVALIGQELCQVPVVGGRGPHQGDEDGLRGHVELEEQTHKPISAAVAASELTGRAGPVSCFWVSASHAKRDTQEAKERHVERALPIYYWQSSAIPLIEHLGLFPWGSPLHLIHLMLRTLRMGDRMTPGKVGAGILLALI